MSLTDRLWLGVAAGSAASIAFGDKDEDLGDRLSKGAMAGGALGLLGPPLLKMGFRPASAAGVGAARLYGQSMVSQYSRLSAAGVPKFKAAFGAFGRLPMLAGAGAAIGAMVDSDDRGRGALIGAGLGAATRMAWSGGNAWKWMNRPVLNVDKTGMRVFGRQVSSAIKSEKGLQFLKPRKWGVIGGVSALAFLGASMMSDNPVTAEASYNPDGSYDDNEPGQAPDTGVRDRVRKMAASGDVVLGAHRRRHG